MATLVRNNFCIAPFTQMTFGPEGRYSPCAEIGGQSWKTHNISEMWMSEDFNALRNSFFKNEKNSVCDRCWKHEECGNQSLRKRLLIGGANKGATFKKGELVEYIENLYQTGPKQINLMVGNICNLRCRICHAGSSVTYNIEGKHYNKKHNITDTLYTSESGKPIIFSKDQINQIFALSGNLQRIEFYGGEPLLDIPTLSLLEKLIESGQSKDIVLFYNTNGTVTPKDKHYQLWNHFKALEFNFSIDDINDRFTYNRHPANWNKLIKNITTMQSAECVVPMEFYAICTISNLNIFYLPELLNELENLNLRAFLNTVGGVKYYDIVYLPTIIKKQIIDKLLQYKDQSKIQFLIAMLNLPEDLNQWDLFKFWTLEKDLYRKESFAETYPEFYNILKAYDKTL
jgi:radical SAM protein with 4Fe4S-binding SPASM domain